MSDTPSQQVPASSPGTPPQTPPTVLVQPPGTGHRRWLTWLGWLGFLICGLILANQWSARNDYYDVTDGNSREI